MLDNFLLKKRNFGLGQMPKAQKILKLLNFFLLNLAQKRTISVLSSMFYGYMIY
jgi:hypothetical protein